MDIIYLFFCCYLHFQLFNHHQYRAEYYFLTSAIPDRCTARKTDTTMKLILLILTVCFFSCTDNRNDNKKDVKVRADLIKSSNDSFPSKELFIDNGEEEGWGADIRLSITEILPSDSFTTYKALSSYEGKKFGLEIKLPNNVPDNKNQLAQLMTIKSLGQPSDNLLSTLSKLYKLKVDTTKRFIDEAKVAFIDLNEFAKSRFGKEPVNRTQAKEMKIFFEANNPDDNAELYLNVNDNEHWLEIREKDDGYRDKVVKFLTKK